MSIYQEALLIFIISTILAECLAILLYIIKTVINMRRFEKELLNDNLYGVYEKTTIDDIFNFILLLCIFQIMAMIIFCMLTLYF